MFLNNLNDNKRIKNNGSYSKLKRSKEETIPDEESNIYFKDETWKKAW
jgi:hypothetical protein